MVIDTATKTGSLRNCIYIVPCCAFHAIWIYDTLNNNNNAIGKSVAGAITMAITVLPFVIIVVTDYSINKSNDKNIGYMQQAFDAPGYGRYKIVAVARIDESSERSLLPLYMEIPLTFCMIAIGIIAIILTKVRKREHMRNKEQVMPTTNLLPSDYNCPHVNFHTERVIIRDYYLR